jgi:hypothetical protein
MLYAPGLAMEPLPSPIAELCALASSRAEERGHDLAGWVDATEDGAVARRAACRRCGRVVYVRVEDAMQGMAGDALTEPCSGNGAAPA